MNKRQVGWRLAWLAWLATGAGLPAWGSGPEPVVPAMPQATDEVRSGAQAYARICAACHGAQGEGGKGPALVPFVYLEAQVMAIVRGGQGEMPPMPEAAISDDDLLAAMAYLLALEEAQQAAAH